MLDTNRSTASKTSVPRSPLPRRAIAPLFLVAILSMAPAALGQVLGQFTTAAISSEGEGTIFMLAGNDAFRTGVAARFRLARVADLGLQLGLDHACGASWWGGGLDVKLALLERREDLPLGIALDVAGGWLVFSDDDRFSLDFGVLVSGALGSTSAGPLEPFVTLAIDVEEMSCDTATPDAESEDCSCGRTDHEGDTSFFARAGIMIPVSKDGRLVVETSLDGRDLFGAGFNLVF